MIKPRPRAENPYRRFEPEKLILRDELAIDRTLLANERTLLAYLRSGVALILAGVTFIHFATQGWFQTVGVVCIPLGLLVMAYGMLRHRSMQRQIAVARKGLGRSAAPEPPTPTQPKST